MGVQLAVDDFGTGFSSLTFLTRVAVDEVKVDRSFVMRMADSPEAAAIVRTTVDLGHELGLRVVAEGVETAEQRAALAELGCTAAQGYHFFKPMPADKIVAVLRSLRTRRRSGAARCAPTAPPDAPPATPSRGRWRGGYGRDMANRLGDATCPYLLQHADNPVDWWPWSAEAFAEAKRRDVPVLISVGYAACHWCHVMAHESFEDESVGAADERQLRADQGGPRGAPRRRRRLHDRDPGDDRAGRLADDGLRHARTATRSSAAPTSRRPNFVRLLQSVTTAWREQREAVAAPGRRGGRGDRRRAGRRRPDRPARPPSCSTPRPTSSPRSTTRRTAGSAARPKFPPHMNLLFLLRHHQRTGDRRSLEIVRHTAEAMARGGIYDQLAGGFARYSVDAHWTVPHFEKMLYDNALLLRVYTQLWRLTGDPLARRVADETAAFLLRDLAPPERRLRVRARRRHRRRRGAHLRLDAGAAGRGARARRTALGRRPVRGHRPRARSSTARACCGWPATSTTPTRGACTLAAASGPAARGPGQRPQPARDDKVVAAWNGLAITALVEYAAAHRDAATSAARRGRERPTVLADRAPGRRPAAPGLPRRRGRRAGRGAGGLRLRGRGVLRACTSSPATGAGSTLAGELLDTALAHFGRRRAASTTPPTTPSGWSPGRPTRPTTPPRPGCRR